jgi:hypothetical protein
MNALRPILLSGLFLMLAILFDSAAQGQNVHSLIRRHLRAMGGKHKLRSIHSLYLETSSDGHAGEKITNKTWIVKDKLCRKESIGPENGTFIMTPTKGWSSNPHGGNWWPTPAEAVRFQQHQLDPTDPFLDYARKGYTIERDGTDTVRGKICYRLKVNFAPGASSVFSIDPVSGYILRQCNGPRGWFHFDFDDYRKTPNGYIFPYKIGYFAVVRLEVNVAIDVEQLSQPKWIRTATAQASYKYDTPAGK